MENYTLCEKISDNNELVKKYGNFLGQLLLNKKIENTHDAENFLQPDYKKNYDPFLLKDCDKTIDRIKTAVEKKEKITIYADYDADGIPGSIILKNLFEKIGHEKVDIYIPHRHKEGYGIHLEALEKIKNSGTSLIISIDVGITAHEAANWCLENNIDLIITDHHLPLSNEDGSQKIPQCYSLVNPKQSDCNYPDDMLCGCAVVYKIIQAFSQKYGEEFSLSLGWEKWLLDMVGVSTISDLVPLQNENRIFAHYGMKVMQKIAEPKNNKRIGLKKLMWDSGVNPRFLTEDDIGFNITPKINAASRMSHPEDAVAVFLAKNELEASVSANHLDSLNKERKKLTKKMTDEAIALVEQQEKSEVIVVGKNSWQLGIVGLVASKLVEKYKKPAFVWAREGDHIKGSCRSLNGIHLVELMQGAQEGTFIGFGGHKEAGGFSCKASSENILSQNLNDSYLKWKEKNGEVKKEKKIIDLELTADHITTENYKNMRLLAPFGMGNVKPLFLFKNILIERANNFGKEKNHLEIYFKDSFGKEKRGICFFKTVDDFEKLADGKICDIVAHMEYSVFMGKHELRLAVVDVL